MQATYEAVSALTGAAGLEHLHDEHREPARAMAAALCRKRPSPLASGGPVPGLTRPRPLVRRRLTGSFFGNGRRGLASGLPYP